MGNELPKPWIYVKNLSPSGDTLQLGRFDFSIVLSGDFALLALQKEIRDFERRRFQKLGQRVVQRIDNRELPEPFYFHENSLLVTQFNIGLGGRWLATSLSNLFELKERGKKLEYYTHNLDTIRDAYVGLALFSLWSRYAPSLLEK